MTLTTALGRVISERWPAFTVEIWAPALVAMASCWAGVVTRSAVPASAQAGMVAQAGDPEGWPSWYYAAGRWTTASTAAWVMSTPLAKHSAKPG